MDENSFEFAESSKIQLSCKTLHESEDLLIPRERRDLQIFGIRIRSDGAREPESVLFADFINKSVKCLCLRSRALSTVYKSEWHVLNLYELDDRKGMLLLERNPKNYGLFSLLREIPILIHTTK